MLNRQNKNNQRRSRQRGLQLVEMAFILPIMIILLGAIGEFGRYFHMRSTLLRATRTSAGYMRDKVDTPAERTAAIRMALCGRTTTPCPANELIYPGLSEANFNVTIDSVTQAPAKYVIVSTVNAMYVPVFNISRLRGSSSSWVARPINVSTRMRYTQ